MESLGSTPSPNKRNTFRSKTKQRETGSTLQQSRALRPLPSFYVYLKEYPLDTNEDVMAILKTFESTHSNFLENLDNLKLYKPQLASLLEDNWRDFMELLRTATLKLTKRTDRVLEQRQKKIAELLQINRELENQQQKWKQKIQKLEELRELEKAQLNIADTELEVVNAQMRDIYEVLQGDMSKVNSYLTKLQARRSASDEQGSTQIYSSLKSLSLLLNNMEKEQHNTHSNLSSMRELIKAMTKCTKVSTSTQVDESELLTKAGTIFSKDQQPTLPFHLAEASSINFSGSQAPHLIDQLKQQQQTHPHDKFKLDKHAEKPWALTPTLLCFLQNMAKQNQNGKVLPWDYTKQLITQIYEQRSNYELELCAGNIGNGMLFDQFVVFYFLNKHRIRRLAEVKLLEFIISLKYYTKYWKKAETFCQLLDVTHYHPPNDPSDPFPYSLDYNTQHFFFTIHKKIITYSCIEDEGTTYVQLLPVKKLMRASLFFTEEHNRSRMLAKLDKDIRSINKIDHCDLDYALTLFLDEYLSCKKKISNTLNRAFSHKFQTNQGYFSLDELQQLFQQMEPIYRTATNMQSRYPIDSKLQLAKLYLYTATSGHNSYDFNANHFLNACQRYGFDAPFPFLHVCPKNKKGPQDSSELKIETAKPFVLQQPTNVSPQDSQIKQIPITENKPSQNLSKQRIDIGVKMFSQHFGILRELRSYVEIFANALKDQKNPQVLWKNFAQIRTVLQRGCEFMRYPLLNSKQ